MRRRLEESIPLGYSAAGEVLAVGEAANGVRVGQRVATAGEAHGEIQVPSANLITPLPEGVSFEEGAFGAVASIALNGVRLASVGPGDRVLVVGLGLVGQLTARLALAAGGLVAGIDLNEWKRQRAAEAGITSHTADDSGWATAIDSTGASGFDAVLVAAATDSSDPMRRSAYAVRDSGTIVLVGDVGMELERRPLYEREATIKVARSYGPGRYDPTYEEMGVDYPLGQVRWTAQRNMQAVMELIAGERLKVADLITHRYAFDEAPVAYELLESGNEPYLGIVLQYESDRVVQANTTAALPSAHRAPSAHLAAGLVGAGRFAQEILLPAAVAAGFGPWTLVSSANGVGANAVADRFGFSDVASDPDEVIKGGDSPVVFIATRHDTHAALAAAALQANKHVFCEKPLALTEDELGDVRQAWSDATGSLMVGFNRRWSPAVHDARDFIDSGSGPIQIIYRINAGRLSESHWLLDRRMGGRLIGEACHFIDTCTALVGHEPVQVTALTSGVGELLLDQDFTIVLGYSDGSQATVTYASSSSTRPGKERVEILGRDHSITIDDFRRLDCYGPHGHTVRRYRGANKGHDAELVAFADVVRGVRDSEAITKAAFVTTRVTFGAVESAMTGSTIRL